MSIAKSISFILLVLSALAVQSQGELQDKVKVHGTVTNRNGQYVSDLLIINQRSYTGTFGNVNGTFEVEANKSDTLIFGGVGYRSIKVCYRDSLHKDSYELSLVLLALRIEVAEAEIFAPRELSKIQEDIARLGYDPSDHRVTGVSAVSSPITYLYEQFSKREKSKRLVAEMENNDRRRDLLKELFQKYVDYEIIDLSDDEFDEFIDFIQVSDAFLQRSTQYDFILFVKDRFRDYQIMQRKTEMREDDYNYHKD